MPKLDICLSPELIKQHSLENTTVVVVDILRATSCMTTGIAHGVTEIRPFADLEACRKMKNKGYLIAGERNGEKLPEFDLGNSPFDYMNADIRNKKIAVTTTNGTMAIDKSKGADHILIGSFLNISATARRVRELNKDVLIFCAGWKGKVNLEDTLFAGALMAKLQPDFTAVSDGPMVAQAAYEQMKPSLLAHILSSSHAQRLKRLNIEKDIAFCMKEDVFEVVPEVVDGILLGQTL